MDIASACLVGKKCRFDGESRTDERIKKMFDEGKIKVVCPESLGRLPIPRTPSEIIGGDGGDVLCGKAKVVAPDGEDRTEEFLNGANKALEVAKRCGAKRAYLKSKSPSCGYGTIFDGTFSGKLKQGVGVTGALFKKNGIEVIEI